MEENNDSGMSEQVGQIIEEKLLNSLHSSMLYFVFDEICSFISEEDESGDHLDTHKHFFKTWKQFANKEIIKEDLLQVNEELNSDQNLFGNLLRNKGEKLQSTEAYQEKYNKILKAIEVKFFENFN
jgi:mannitol-1-phosphate/altronate dehydrogenase